LDAAFHISLVLPPYGNHVHVCGNDKARDFIPSAAAQAEKAFEVQEHTNRVCPSKIQNLQDTNILDITRQVAPHAA
jgi:hypothetical protein